MIAVFCPFHDRPDLAYEQLANYRKLFKGNAKFFLHLSSDARKKNITEYTLMENMFDDVEIAPESFQTSFNCIFGAFLSCSSHLFEKYKVSDFSHVFLHSDADLLLKDGIYQHIIKNDIGFGGGYMKMPCKDDDPWPHARRMYEDSVFVNIIEELALPENSLHRGRQEGAFFPFDVWYEIYLIAKGFYPWDKYFESTKEWPLEEVFIPTICKSVLKVAGHTKHTVVTKPVTQAGGRKNPDNAYSIDEVKDFMLNGEPASFGIKRLPLDIKHPVRKYVRKEILGLDEELTLPW